MRGSVGASHHNELQDLALGDLAMVVQDLARTLTNLDLAHDPEIIQLAPVESMVMAQIDASPGITPRQIAEALDLKSSNAAAALRSLESHGFFERLPDSHDRRVTHLHPTPLAQTNLARVKEAWTQALTPSLSDDADPASLVTQLTSLRDGLRQAGH